MNTSSPMTDVKHVGRTTEPDIACMIRRVLDWLHEASEGVIRFGGRVIVSQKALNDCQRNAFVLGCDHQRHVDQGLSQPLTTALEQRKGAER